MTPRLVVIGGDAAGMSAASTAKKRCGDNLEVVAFERGQWTSYSACGIPYWISGDVEGPDGLVARSAPEHRANGIDVRLGHEVVAIDAAAGEVTVRSDGAESTVGYDELMIATGAEPLRPDLPGIGSDGIFGVQNLVDGQQVIDALRRGPRRAVVVGSGYIGVEMAEACLRHGLQTTLVDEAVSPMGLLDVDLGARIHVAMSAMGIDVRMSTPVWGFASSDAGAVNGVVTDSETIPADIVILGLGVRARSDLAAAAGLPIGESGAIRADAEQRVDADRHVWAGGDCVESWHRLLRRHVHVPLGTHANKHGWTAGRNISSAVLGDLGPVEFPGIIGTAVTRVCDLEIAITGLSVTAAREAGYDPEEVSIESTTRAAYFPGVAPLTIKMIADRLSRRVLGAQIVGREGSALRIDTVATALWAGLTVDDVMLSDLAYAPPFSPVWDPVQVAARALAGKLGY